MSLTDVLGAALPAAGMAIGGPVGAAVGALAGGLVQNASADNQMRDWDRLDKQIPTYDPQQVAFMSRLKQQEKQFRGGTDPSTALSNRLAQQAGSQTQANLTRAGGPGLVQNLLSSQNVTQRNNAQIGANAATQANGLLGMQGDLTNLMSQRAYDRQRYRRDIALANAQQTRQDANNQMMSAIGALPQVTAGGFKVGTGINREARTGYRGGPEMQVLDPLPIDVQSPALPPMTPTF